jgi:hypothetical protein
MMRFLGMVIVMMGLGAASLASAQDTGGTQSPFVQGTGAREQAMGRASVAISRSADALFWNPARLTSVVHPEFSLYRSQLFVDGSVYHAGSVAYPTMDFGVFGIGYQRIDVSDIERRDDRNRLLGDFSSSDSNLMLGYGRSFGALLSAGATLRVVQQNVDTYSDAALGFDLGMALHKPLDRRELHRILLGAAIQNVIEPKLRLLADEVEDPRSLRLGAGYEGGTLDRDFQWTVGADMVVAKRSSWTGGIGSELTYADALSLRLGLDGSRPTFGVGVQWRLVRFDYALRSDDVLPRADRFTLAVHFGTSVEERRHERRVAQDRQVTDQLARLLQERERQELERALTAAHKAHSEHEWQEALRLYRRVLALDPTHEEARRQRDAIELRLQLAEADAMLQTNQPAQAAGLYQSILTTWPDEPRALEGLRASRLALQALADRDQAVRELFKEALEQFTHDNFAGSQASLRELLRLEPEHELGLDLQERITSRIQKQGEEALREARRQAHEQRYEVALRGLQKARDLLGDRQDLRSLQEQWERAQRDVRRQASQVARKQPAPSVDANREDTTPRAPRNLTPEERRELQQKYQEGLAAFSKGDFDAAIRNWHAVWFVDPEMENISGYLIKAYLFQCVELYGRGQYDEALDRCKRVLEIDPTNEKALRYLDRIEEEKLELEQIEGDGSDE